MSEHWWCFFLQAYVRRGTSVYGPLTPHEIKDMVISKYNKVCLIMWSVFGGGGLWIESW